MTCASSSNQASSGTACSHRTYDFNTVVNRAPFSLRDRSRASAPQDLHRGRRALRQALRTDPQMEHESPNSTTWSTTGESEFADAVASPLSCPNGPSALSQAARADGQCFPGEVMSARFTDGLLRLRATRH
jgi:hypothetical protein